MMQGQQMPLAKAPVAKTVSIREQPVEEASAPAAPIVRRDTGGPLQVSAGMDAKIIEAKIKDIAASIIGDDEDLDVDIPLMSAGITSNTAVLLRDELSGALPGVKLPPTLMFDYP